MTTQVDLLVIGTGIGGSIVARKCREAGWQVAIVDARNYGGTCAVRGCSLSRLQSSFAAAV